MFLINRKEFILSPVSDPVSRFRPTSLGTEYYLDLSPGQEALGPVPREKVVDKGNDSVYPTPPTTHEPRVYVRYPVSWVLGSE